MASTLSPAEVIALTRRHESTAVNTFGWSADPPVPVSASGARIYDADGRSWLDLVCGSAVSNLGHADPRVAQAMREQIDTGLFHTGTRLPSAARAALYQALAARLPPTLQRIHLLNSGAEAIECAIKAAHYVSGRRNIVAFSGGYHGRTMGALSVTASAKLRQPFLPLCPEVSFLSYPAPAMWPCTDPPEVLNKSEIDALAELDALACQHDIEARPSMLLLEAVQGVSGVHVLRPVFLRALRDICDRYRIVFIVDEIWNGFGRTGHWFAFEAAGITPDLVVIGKALSGALPLAAVIGSDELLGRWPAGMHTSTFQGNPIACAAATASVQAMAADGLVQRAREVLAPHMLAALMPLYAVPAVRAVRVIGALAGIELIDPHGQPNPTLARQVQAQAFADGVLIYTGGRHGEVLMLIPPLVITAAELDLALAVLTAALAALTPN